MDCALRHVWISKAEKGHHKYYVDKPARGPLHCSHEVVIFFLFSVSRVIVYIHLAIEGLPGGSMMY